MANESKSRRVRLGALVLALAAGCGAGRDDALGSAESELVNWNSLNLNALNMNALNLNALNLNALNLNALNLNSLDPSTLSTLQGSTQNSAQSRAVLQYMVGCALRTDQSISITWTDSLGASHPETYHGLLGLAPDWSWRGLYTSEAEWVSACVASRANYYGTPVEISSRGEDHPELRVESSSYEALTFTHFEGAFWGNLFGDAPYLRSCYIPAQLSYSRAVKRECAAGHQNGDGSVGSCGPIQRQGSCLDGVGGSSAPCLTNDGYYLQDCKRPNGTRTDRVITTWLR